MLQASSSTAASQTLAPKSVICSYFLQQSIHHHFICFCYPESDILLPEWANHLKPSNIVGALKIAFFSLACCLEFPRVRPTPPPPGLLTVPDLIMSFWIFQSWPGWSHFSSINQPLCSFSCQFLYLNTNSNQKHSRCLQLTCSCCKIQWLIEALTLWYHHLLKTGKVGEARVFAMTSRLLRSLKLS